MKKNYVVRIAALVVMCALVTACFASSTFAKYTSSQDASGTLTVADWSFNLNDEDIATATASASLFDDVEIYPGYSDTFDIKVENTSDVDSVYSITFKANTTMTNAPSLSFKCDGTALTKAADGTYTVASNAELAKGAAAKTYTITVTWDGTNDTADTKAGVEGGSVTIDAALVASQKTAA